MKLSIVLATLVAVGCATAEQKAPPLEMSTEEMEAKMMEYGTPGEAHAELAQMVGTWKTEMTTWWDPDGEPVVSTGQSTMETIMDGRYVVEHFDNTVMDMPFKGMLILGYDNFNQEYVSVWLDNFSTQFAIARGKENAEGDMELSGEMSDFVSPGGRTYRIKVHHESDDRSIFEMWDTGPDGKLWKTMETVYTRL